jgi:tetratricopeptide (TPR) repeat protein
LIVLLLAARHTMPFAGLQDPVREAQRLRDTRQFAAAVQLLDEHLRRNPDDAEAARMRAQTLYWLEDFAGARAAYAAALERHPANERIRVDYARMLAETGDRRRAKALLETTVGTRQGSADAVTLLGTILYWDGDLARAQRLFVDALRRDPAQADAARQLREIEILSASWVRVAPTVWHDDQPLDHAGAAFEAGWFATPLLPVSARVTPRRYSTDLARTFWNTELEASHFAPAARLDTRLSVGTIRRPQEQGGLDWTARASLGIRAASGFTVRGRFEREPYLNTVASLETSLMTKTAAAVVDWSHGAGWLGEAAVERQAFPDANVIRSAYAWVMAPLVGSGRRQLQGGYAIAAADADEDRFVLAHQQQSVLPSDPRFDLSGVYRPYYTPARILSHSLIASATLDSVSGPVLRTGGSYGFRAAEDATQFGVLGETIVASIGRRTFTPWTARASVEIPASRSVTLNLGGETGRTAYYHWTSATFVVVYRLVPHAPGNAQRR